MTITSIYRLCAVFTISFFTASLLLTSHVTAQETEDAKMFLSGFNTYQQKDYPKAAKQLTNLLQKYPGTPMRDMALFWLARSHYNANNKPEAARYMAQFSKEYPDSPLRNTAEEELLELAKQKAEEERLATAKKEEEERLKAAEEAKRIAEEKAKAEQLAKQRAEEERLAAVKKEEEERLKAAAEAKRIAEEKAKAEQLAKQRAEEERLAAVKKEEERLAAAKKEEEQLKVKAEAKRISEEEAKAEQLAKQRAEEERLAAAKKEEKERLKAAEEAKWIAEEKAKAEQLAKQKAEEERLAAAKKEEEARLKAAEEARRVTEEKAKAEQLAKQKAEEERLAQQRQQAFKDKAIAEYKGIIERFPGTPAAQSAAERLKELGIAVALPATVTESASSVEAGSNTQVFTLEVAQYAAFELSAQSPRGTIPVGQNFQVPFVLQNLGNGIDSFYLVSGFPPEFNARFVAAAAPDKNINQTPALEPGESFAGLLQLNMPVGYIDGFRLAHPIKAASSFMPEATQSRIVSAITSAPLLRAVVKTDKSYISPQEIVPYHIAIMNVGSATASDVTLKINFPPQYAPVEYSSNTYRQEMGAALVTDGINLKPGESRNFTADFQLKTSALANEELIVRTDLLNNQLELNAAFISNAVFVRPVSNLEIKLATNTLQAMPGQVLTLPVRLINKGNQREKINLSVSGTVLQQIRIFQDLNRDGLLQHGEPEISTVGPLGSKEEVVLLLEISTLKNALDGSGGKITLNATPETGMGDAVMASATVNYSRPQLQLAMKGRQGKMTPGELITVDFEVLNSGSSLAKMAQLEVTWPHQLELVTTDQTASSSSAGTSTWNLKELGAGEKKLIKASFRIKSGTGVGTGLQLKSALSYQDLMGNRY